MYKGTSNKPIRAPKNWQAQQEPKDTLIEMKNACPTNSRKMAAHAYLMRISQAKIQYHM